MSCREESVRWSRLRLWPSGWPRSRHRRRRRRPARVTAPASVRRRRVAAAGGASRPTRDGTGAGTRAGAAVTGTTASGAGGRSAGSGATSGVTTATARRGGSTGRRAGSTGRRTGGQWPRTRADRSDALLSCRRYRVRKPIDGIRDPGGRRQAEVGPRTAYFGRTDNAACGTSGRCRGHGLQDTTSTAAWARAAPRGGAAQVRAASRRSASSTCRHTGRPPGGGAGRGGRSCRRRATGRGPPPACRPARRPPPSGRR